MKVYLLSVPAINWAGWSEFELDHVSPTSGSSHWSGDPGAYLAELAGRICYMSYGKGRKTTGEFIGNIISSGHHSVLEHANYTLFITGISRSCSHELVRHRHLSFSQLSQRYVDESKAEMIMPPVLNEIGVEDVFHRSVATARTAYDVLVANLEVALRGIQNPTERRKAARQAARSVLPNATETKIAVTGNARAWRQFIELRASKHADPEIRALAVRVFQVLGTTSPLLFGDLTERVAACAST